MNMKNKRARGPGRMAAFEIPKPWSEDVVVPRRTVLETKRSILKKLSLRIRKDCFSRNEPSSYPH
jgi:hypothetical protein